jgi:uncharacterized protein with FMN-binding domain
MRGPKKAVGFMLLACAAVLWSCVDVSSVVITMPDLSRIRDGVFDGQCTVGPVFARVEVAVEAGAITSFTILEHRNGRGKPAEALASLVVEKQTLALDAVSGATYSSKAILKAGENALQSAGQNAL